LPRNLSDEWLNTVSRSVNHLLAGEPEGTGAVAIAAVHVLLQAKTSRGIYALGEEEAQQRLMDYRLELALELTHRNTDVKYEPATLETIFTDRDVRTWREEGR
jgi:hypothetical protein